MRNLNEPHVSTPSAPEVETPIMFFMDPIGQVSGLPMTLWNYHHPHRLSVCLSLSLEEHDNKENMVKTNKKEENIE